MAFRRWFPRSLQEQATFFANFTRVFAEIALRLGFTAEDIAALEADNAVMRYLVQTEFNIKTFKRSFQSLRDNLTRGKGVKNPIYMQYTPLPEPPIVPYGIFDRLFKLADHRSRRRLLAGHRRAARHPAEGVGCASNGRFELEIKGETARRSKRRSSLRARSFERR